MAQPTLSLTFQDLIIREAEYLGVADYSGGAAAIPTNAHDLDLCKRLINDGYRRALADNDEGWEALRPIFTITFVVGQQGYDMPDGFNGTLITPFTYPTTGPRIRIDVCDESVIRLLQAGNASSGDPRLVALQPKTVGVATTGPRWQAIFWPTPSSIVTVTARCQIVPDKLVNNADQHVLGFSYDQLILEAALAEAERNRNDSAGIHEGAYQQRLEVAKKLNRKTLAKRLGDYGDKGDDFVSNGGRYFTGVDSYTYSTSSGGVVNFNS
jgi:hypothetical protein